MIIGWRIDIVLLLMQRYGELLRGLCYGIPLTSLTSCSEQNIALGIRNIMCPGPRDDSARVAGERFKQNG